MGNVSSSRGREETEQTHNITTKPQSPLDHLQVVVGDHTAADFSGKDFCGALIQYPNTCKCRRAG